MPKQYKPTRFGQAFLAGLSLLLLASWTVASPPPKKAANKEQDKTQGEFVVHEWGTFLAVQGSDGTVQGGMVDSDEVLPPFVDSRTIQSWQRSQIFDKMETPVTYFYTDRPRHLQVRIDMPKGLLTHWYPAVRHYGPGPATTGKMLPEKGFLDWRFVRIVPDTPAMAQQLSQTHLIEMQDGRLFTGQIEVENQKEIQLITGSLVGGTLAKEQIARRSLLKTRWAMPKLSKVRQDLAWRFARETDAALVEVPTYKDDGSTEIQTEKFLFYRGLGTFSLPLEVRSKESCKTNLTLTLHNQNAQPLRGLFAVQVDQETISYASLSDLNGKSEQVVSDVRTLFKRLPLSHGVPEVKGAVAKALVSAGLYAKEAQAMVNTWERSYFRTEGLRLLYILPRSTVDEVIPIQIKPAPEKVVRVMIGRVEVLTPSRERQIEQFVSELGAKEFKKRHAATTGLARLGRITEPALRRVATTTQDPEVRSRAQTLISRIGSAN